MLVGLFAAPAIVKFDALMPLRYPKLDWGWDFGTGDFTIETWVKYPQGKLQHVLVLRENNIVRGYRDAVPDELAKYDIGLTFNPSEAVQVSEVRLTKGVARWPS